MVAGSALVLFYRGWVIYMGCLIEFLNTRFIKSNFCPGSGFVNYKDSRIESLVGLSVRYEKVWLASSLRSSGSSYVSAVSFLCPSLGTTFLGFKLTLCLACSAKLNIIYPFSSLPQSNIFSGFY